jgi:hypothetical protein
MTTVAGEMGGHAGRGGGGSRSGGSPDPAERSPARAAVDWGRSFRGWKTTTTKHERRRVRRAQWSPSRKMSMVESGEVDKVVTDERASSFFLNGEAI